jgi:hypothetical protein
MVNPVKGLISALGANIYGGGSNASAINYGGGVARPSEEDPLGINADSKRPTARLDQDPFKFSTFSYPQDVVNNLESGHYMLFYVNVQNNTRFNYMGYKDGQVVPVGGTIMDTKTRTETEAVSGSIDEGNYKTVTKHFSEETMQKGGDQKVSFEQLNRYKGKNTQIYSDRILLGKHKQKPMFGFNKEFNNTTRITDSVAMYLPPNVTDDYGVNYTATETGALGFLIATAGGMVGEWKEKDFEGFLRSGLKGLETVAYEQIKNLALGFAEGITSSEGGVELANKIFSRAQNPHMEVLFNGPKMRSFTYSFTMAPKSEDEQLECKNIIKLFRFHMAPKVQERSQRFMTLPSEFDIHYMYQAPSGQSGQNNFYNKVATCVLSDCKVDYTPGGVNSHIDGSPVIIKMDLTFQETEMITQDHVEAGF